MTTINASTLSMDHVRTFAPASFAMAAAESTSATYRFINTAEIMGALMDAGFQPTHATQARSRKRAPGFARHELKFRVPVQEVDLHDCVPNLCLVNSHDGSSSYQLRAGLERLVCRNGLLVPMANLSVIRISHRKGLVGDLVAGAQRIAEQFKHVGPVVRAMRERELQRAEREFLARRAIELRYGEKPAQIPVTIESLLQPRRTEDADDTLWCVFNRLQEALIQGGVPSVTRTGRHTRTRAISSIGRSIAINEGLWSIASRMLN
jgi:hypothetical protein